MTSTDGQLSIFDELTTKEPHTTCPYCHFSWTGPTLLSRHIEGSNGWAFGGSEVGKCENQKLYLFQVGSQSHFGLRSGDGEPNLNFKTDLLGKILEAKQFGCTDKQIRKVLS